MGWVGSSWEAQVCAPHQPQLPHHLPLPSAGPQTIAIAHTQSLTLGAFLIAGPQKRNALSMCNNIASLLRGAGVYPSSSHLEGIATRPKRNVRTPTAKCGIASLI